MKTTIHDPLIEIVVPVYNQVSVLSDNVEHLDRFLRDHFPFRSRVTIADNASTDGTDRVAEGLATRLERVSALRLERKGRGHALRTAWLASDADIVSYMDVDLSTNLESFLPLVAPLVSGHADVAIGTRLARGSHTTRRIKREVLSRGYNGIVRTLFRAPFADGQCGFKALRADVARRLVPHVENENWFFDTELLLLAARNGYRIFEVSVDWIEDLDSRVALVPTIAEDLAGLWRVRRAFWHGREDSLGDGLQPVPVAASPGDRAQPVPGTVAGPATPSASRGGA